MINIVVAALRDPEDATTFTLICQVETEDEILMRTYSGGKRCHKMSYESFY